MEPWEPEEIFEKADFPARKSKPEKKAGQPGANRVPPGGGSGRPAPRSQPAGVPAPPSAIRPQNRRGPGDVWEPELDFERVDFSGVPPEEAVARGDTRSSSDTMANVTAGRGGPSPATPQVGAWRPPRISEAAQKNKAPGPKTNPEQPPAAQTPRVVGSRIRQGPGATGPAPFTGGRPTGDVVRKTNAGSGTGAGVPVEAAIASSFSRRLLEELAITHRENARHILRHWYWEKPGMAPEGLAHIPPHDRIYIVLAALGSPVLVAVYESMSPTERRQMQEILDQPRPVSGAQVNRVLTVFMNSLRGQV